MRKLIFAALYFLPVLAFSFPTQLANAANANQNVAISTRSEGGISYQVIHYPKGTFFLNKTLSIGSNTIVEGEGSGTKLVPMPKNFGGAQFVSNSDYRNGNSNIKLRNLKIEFSQKLVKGDNPGIVRFQNVNNLSIENITMTGRSDMYFIDLAASCRNVALSGCSISNMGGGCLMLRNQDSAPSKASYAVQISGNSFVSGMGDEPVAVFGWLGDVHGVQVSNNRVDGSHSSFGIAAYGIDKPTDTGTLYDVTISGNTVTGGKFGGIAVKGGASRVTVSKNVVSATTNDGIFLHTGGASLPVASSVTITGNTLTAIGRHGIFATGSDIVVSGNSITNCGQSGVYVGDNVQVVSNTISNAAPGILVEGTVNRVVKSNTLTNAIINVLNNDWAGITDNVVRHVP
ncbi:hypothetical protein GMST_26420 [Geomonas silvestris]|uniref:Right handed beta helix domain-containing protein n=1 Tax=Geomonas silvestris TaxID=2740184 RepID=A0A6V8MK67_9BACT|nr:right-handed parallel beta-helix repeat-containing protein [Geomonas silvestris]GFO60317.1 hypothetical protein GMST_26420 [Geomonas silvestris]